MSTIDQFQYSLRQIWGSSLNSMDFLYNILNLNFLYDILNFEFIVIVSLIVVTLYLRLEPLKVGLLFLHLTVIFLLNSVLFNPSYFGDQFGYTIATQMIRDSFKTLSFQEISGFSMEMHDSTIKGFLNPQGASGLIFALMPIPFINSIQSICMINYLLFLLLFVFIKKRFISNNLLDYFFLSFPSLLLYSSLALRETIILVIMFFSIYTILIKERNVLGLLISLPLLIIKFQNFFIIVLSFILYTLLKRHNKIINTTLALIILFGIFLPEKIPIIGGFYNRIDELRLALLAENMVKVTGKFYDWEAARALYEPLGSGISLVFLVIKNFFYMLLKPLPWEIKNPFHVVQSIENIVIFIMLIILNTKKITFHRIRNKILFLNIFLFVSISIYGLVVFNFGTAARYKFTFIVIYFVFFFIFLQFDKILKIYILKGKFSVEK